jgi:hypothetical protein
VRVWFHCAGVKTRVAVCEWRWPKGDARTSSVEDRTCIPPYGTVNIVIYIYKKNSKRKQIEKVMAILVPNASMFAVT